MKSWLQQTLLRKAQTAGLLGPEIAAAVEQRITAGQALEDSGDPAAALTRYTQAIELDPRSAKAHLNAGNARRLLGDNAGAVTSYRNAVELDPASAAAHFNLGTALMSDGGAEAAVRAYRAALELRPDWAEAWVGLACALEEGGQESQAVAAYSRGLALEPQHAGAAHNLSSLQQRMLDVNAACATLREFLRHVPNHRESNKLLALLEMEAGRFDEGLAILRQLLVQQPDDFAVWHVLLFHLGYATGLDAQENLREHLQFGRLLESRIPAWPLPQPGPDDRDRRLRVGYVSGDFNLHPVTNFIHPVLRCHDRRRFEITCYHTLPRADRFTSELQELADYWCAAADLDDEALAQKIRQDRIDILVDLSGHSTGNRLATFARKPATLQFTWLGYLGTTGLSRMDYRICDGHTDPAGIADAWHSEKPARLPHSQWCYDPRIITPLPPSPLPRLTNRYWTFGSFNNYRKLNESVYAAWAEVLRAIPGSRLRLISFENAASGERALERLTAQGIERQRLSWHLRGSEQDYVEAFSGVDVALDSFPYNGATTTCDSLLMGLPVLAVAGRRALARGGVSLLRTIGLTEWIADSEQALATVAQRQLSQVEAVARLRTELPRRMRASPLMDAAQFTRDLEEQYDIAWRHWCDGAG